MSDIPGLSGPPGDNADNFRHRRGRRRASQIPSREILLAFLAQLLTLVSVGIIPAAEANVARSIIEALLKYQEPKTARGSSRGGIDLTTLRSLLRSQPLLLDALEPFLDDEQLDQILGRENDDNA